MDICQAMYEKYAGADWDYFDPNEQLYNEVMKNRNAYIMQQMSLNGEAEKTLEGNFIEEMYYTICRNNGRYELKELEEKANQGDAEAQFKMGDYYQWDANPRDIATAIKWYERAANNEHRGGQYALGLCYSSGNGVAESFEKGLELLEKAAEKGYAPAQYFVGEMYYYGDDENDNKGKDYEKALKWHEKSAEQGYAPSQVELAVKLLSIHKHDISLLKKAQVLIETAIKSNKLSEDVLERAKDVQSFIDISLTKLI